jgi:hypothetical protein
MIYKQEVLGRTNHLLSSDTIRTAQKTTPPTIIRCSGNVSTKQLSSDDRGIHTERERGVTGFPLIQHRQYRKQHFQQYYYCVYLLPRERVYLAVLSQRYGGIHIQTQTDRTDL